MIQTMQSLIQLEMHCHKALSVARDGIPLVTCSVGSLRNVSKFTDPMVGNTASGIIKH